MQPRSSRRLGLLAAIWLLALPGCEAPAPASVVAKAPRSTKAPRSSAAPRRAPDRAAPDRAAPDLAALRAAIADRAHERWVQGSATVLKVLPDDLEGSRHQRFLLRVDAGTVLVAHNIDLAPRAPVAAGALVGFRGSFIWNDKGGVLHWTHHDPKGRPGGWLEVAGRRFE